MKIVCFIVVLIEIMKEVHTLNCHTHNNVEDPKPEDCNPDEMCRYTIRKDKDPNKIIRDCMPKDNALGVNIGKCIVTPIWTTCACDTYHCNNYCPTDKCPPPGEPGTKLECDTKCKAEKNDTTPNDATTKNQAKTNPTDDNAQATSEGGPQRTDNSSGATSEDGPQPTEDGTGGTGEDGPQPTEDRSGATAEDAEETQKPTGKASTNSVNLIVVESNQFVLAIWILAILVIRSFYYKQTVTNALFINS